MTGPRLDVVVSEPIRAVRLLRPRVTILVAVSSTTEVRPTMLLQTLTQPPKKNIERVHDTNVATHDVICSVVQEKKYPMVKPQNTPLRQDSTQRSPWLKPAHMYEVYGINSARSTARAAIVGIGPGSLRRTSVLGRTSKLHCCVSSV